MLLSGQQGPVYFLVPVLGDVTLQDQDLRTALAKASLRESWAYARETGADKMTNEEIDAEIALVRAEQQLRATK